ncbi:gamma-glutamyl hydrolase A-like [Hyposmocoma kahamanoa]|uniref:gamma-glutamyl hydrolase A-like n=1 Tax=Hyposmocoma kahamanoa TaxID=1477025 RepID=UPI000E6D8FD4|nr:gamma-glutamyl hydrolase A-like [Hyposmocoma kahamanoa]
MWWLNVSSDNWIGFVTMKSVLLLLVIHLLHCEGRVVVRRDEQLNNRPIIGVLSQEQSKSLQKKYPKENYTSYIAASYVKDVEASGARVVPILIGKDRKYYRELMQKINGVLFPGGATYFNQSNGYADAGQHIYEIAKQMNDRGDYFPIFGTCLGFELMIIIASGRGEVENRIECDVFENLPLRFDHGYKNSKMFSAAPQDVLTILSTQDVTVNYHMFCIIDQNLKNFSLDRDWLVTSHSTSTGGSKFIASIEHKRYPFYGVQFHPEKTFEWKQSKNYPHTVESIKANRYFMDFFVNECRKSDHTFNNVVEENKYLIYNYVPHFTGVLGSAYHQCYMFEPRGITNSCL